MDITSVEEAPEFQPAVIEALRTPLESGVITLGRSEVHARYPARFQLILAANPCPCGQAATPGAPRDADLQWLGITGMAALRILRLIQRCPWTR